MSHRTLIVGGARSGKSRLAEKLATDAAGRTTGANGGDGVPVVYVAPGYPAGDDAEWAARVAAHQARRPASWRTVETTDVAGVLASAGATEVILVDGLGTWLARILDDTGAWSDVDGWPERLDAHLDALVAAWTDGAATVVVVSDEVGLGVVPATASGRLFRDLLGRLNQRMGASADGLYLVVAGRALDLTASTAI